MATNIPLTPEQLARLNTAYKAAEAEEDGTPPAVGWSLGLTVGPLPEPASPQPRHQPSARTSDPQPLS